MDTNPDPSQITHDFPPFFRVHNTGHVERYIPIELVPASHDPQTGVLSKDIVISPEKNISVRIYLPQTTRTDPKQPLIVYIHGGAFSTQSAFSSVFHRYLNTLSARSGYVAVSIEYRLAPEHPVPAAYDDCWAALQWVESHSRVGKGPDPWLNEYVDLKRVYFAGDSSGANVAHDMVIRAGNKEYTGNDEFGLRIAGLVLVHPFFGISGKSNKLWNFICPDMNANYFRYNPCSDSDLLSSLRCERVLVCLAEKDFLFRKLGLNYYETLKKSNWKGKTELYESPGEHHAFHLLDQDCDQAGFLMNRVVCFFKNKPYLMSRF